MKKIIALLVGVSALAGCQMQNSTAQTIPTEAIASKTVYAAIAARSSELKGVHHGSCEDAAFYTAIGNMRSPEQVRGYYSQRGFDMSEDGSGGTAIAALTGQPFSGRMPGKAVCFERAAQGRL